MPKKEPEDLSAWHTKEDVARILRTSPKTVERMAARGELTQALRQRTGLRPAPVYRPEDVERERLKTIATIQPGDAGPATALERAGAVPGLAALLELARAAGARVPSSPNVALDRKLVLSLAEAVEYSGVTRSRVRAAIDAGELAARRDEIGRGFRIKRAELEAWVESL